MKTKRILIAVLTAALFTAFMIACSVPLEDTSLVVVEKAKEAKEAKEKPAPNGKIRVKLNVVSPETNARTVKPDLSGVTMADFHYFLLKVYDNSGTLMDVDAPFDNFFVFADFAEDLVIDGPDGNYDFLIIACDSNTGTIKYLACGMDTARLYIVLKQIVGDAPSGYLGTGTFSWDVDESLLTDGEFTTAILTLDTFAAANQVTADLLHKDGEDDFDQNTGSNSNIPSGYYKMVCTGNSPCLCRFYVYL